LQKIAYDSGYNQAFKISLATGVKGLNLRSMISFEKQVFVAARSAERKPLSPNSKMPRHTRREFAKWSLAACAGAGVLSVLNRLSAAETMGKPNSKVAGVQIGLNVPYSFHSDLMSGDEILNKCLQLGISAVELRTQPVEAFLGLPAYLMKAKNPAANAGELAKWRSSVSMDRVKEFRQKYEGAGVFIEIVKVDGIFKMTDDELDYEFALAKALGGRAISTEISNEEKDLERLGKFADKHQFMVGYHGHAKTKPEHWEKAFSLAKYNGANVDIGHFVAGNNTSPVPFIKQYHDRITHVHIKDRKMHEGLNMPFGEGDTPIVEVLRLLRDNKWNIQATIEFEYKVPAGSDQMTEIARSIKYCRDALA
jgi:sugar phosphate isomerase/epimerase